MKIGRSTADIKEHYIRAFEENQESLDALDQELEKSQPFGKKTAMATPIERLPTNNKAKIRAKIR